MIEVDIVKAREVAKTAARTLRPLRTERTFRHMAKNFAAAWWDESVKWGDMDKLNQTELTPQEKAFASKRSEMFRTMWPDRQIYVTICWPHFYKMARDQAVSMLHHNSGVSEVMKERIYKAWLDDRTVKGN